jgi:prevent-host-death family protein
MQNYSIAEAKNSLSRLVHEAEEGQRVHLTRRGELVAILLSVDEFKKINSKKSSPADALQKFLSNKAFKNVDIAPSVFSDLRVKTSGRDIQL